MYECTIEFFLEHKTPDLTAESHSACSITYKITPHWCSSSIPVSSSHILQKIGPIHIVRPTTIKIRLAIFKANNITGVRFLGSRCNLKPRILIRYQNYKKVH